MAKKKNTRQQIIKQAILLFKKQGYSGTSIKQITEVVGISAPALYYFFPEGKLELLRAVVKELKMDPATILEPIKSARSLAELISLINIHLPQLLEIVATDISWLHFERPHLPDEEKAFVNKTIMTTVNIIQTEAKRHISCETQARRFAWMVMLAHNGYLELFKIYHLNEYDPFSQVEFNETLSAILMSSDFYKQNE